MTLHAVVVRQPWASLVAHGIKQIETRGFAPKSTVRPGDRLTVRATVVEVRRSKGQSALGILRWRWQLFNAKGTEVLDLEATSLFDLAP